MGITLKDVAIEAGVSISTVSIVMRKDTKLTISSETRARVLDAARKLNYQYNSHARALRKGKSQLIGLMMIGFNSGISLARYRALDRLVASMGYRSIVRESYDVPGVEESFIQEFAGSMVEGVILAQGSRQLTKETLEPLFSRNIPIVTLEHLPSVSLDCITVDRRHGVYTAVRHLLELGHKRIALIHGPLFEPTNIQRFEGYKQALAESNIETDESILFEICALDPYAEGYNLTRKCLDIHSDVTAIVCNNDTVAIGAIRCLSEKGIKVPDEIAIIGFDNSPVSAYTQVSLTSVAQPVEEQAKRAVELLFSRINKELQPDQRVIEALKPELVIRESSGNMIGLSQR